MFSPPAAVPEDVVDDASLQRLAGQHYRFHGGLEGRSPAVPCACRRREAAGLILASRLEHAVPFAQKGFLDVHRLAETASVHPHDGVPDLEARKAQGDAAQIQCPAAEKGKEMPTGLQHPQALPPDLRPGDEGVPLASHETFG